MSVQRITPIIAWFDTRIATVTTEQANPAGGGFKQSGYRMAPGKEPDSALEGLYYVDAPSSLPNADRRSHGTGENIWQTAVLVQLGYFRGGGDAGGGDRRTVMVKANDDCMGLADVCENPDYYDSGTTGIRRVLYQGHRRAFELKRGEVWEVEFFVEWRSDRITA